MNPNADRPSIHRRDALRGLAALSLSPLVRLPKSAGSAPEVLVIGGGLSGLVALDECRRQKIPARLWEGGQRLGGRIFTVRDGLAEGLRAEYGGERVPHGHRRMNTLLDRYRIERIAYPSEPPVLFRVDGKHHPWNGGIPAGLGDGLSELESQGSPLGIQNRYCQQVESVPESDQRNGLQWLLAQGLTPAGRRLVEMFCPFPLERMKAADFHRACRHAAEASQSGTLKGGCDRLTDALAKEHAPAIETGRRVKSLQRQGERWVAIDSEGRKQVADRVILCLPLAPTRRLTIAGEAGTMVRRRCDELALGHEIKIHMQVEKAKRDAAGRGSFSLGDRFPRIVWTLPETSANGRVILNSMAIRDDIRTVGPVMTKAGALQKYLGLMDPELAALSEKTLAYDWKADELIGGTFTFSPPGRTGSRRVERRDGLILAGGDFSSLPGWMEGAVASAQVAVKEALK